jgi:hypothetical protein
VTSFSGYGGNGGYGGYGGNGSNGGYSGSSRVADRWVGGVVTGLARKYTRKGELMATFFLEDLESSIEVFVFPRTMTEVGYLLADDAVICVKGRLDLRDEVPKLVCSELKRPQLSLDGATPWSTPGSNACANCSRSTLGLHPSTCMLGPKWSVYLLSSALPAVPVF